MFVQNDLKYMRKKINYSRKKQTKKFAKKKLKLMLRVPESGTLR